MQPSVSVVHLIWIPYGLSYFIRFVESYKIFRSGYSHELVLLFNGVNNENDTAPYHHYAQQAGLSYQFYSYTKGQDLEAYQWVANQLLTDYILFTNSYSRFLADDWLLKFVQALNNNNIGLIGATGSWQSYYSTVFKKNTWSWAKGTSLQKNIAKYKLLLKALFLWRWYFDPFPNPHVRTNGFLISRQNFMMVDFKNPKTKFDAYRIESGKNSITKQISRKGLQVLLVDKLGNTFEPKQWKTANIFWNDNQENLLIADNQTELYANADLQNKKLLQKLAWGKNNFL